MAMARSIVLGMLSQSQCCYNYGDKIQDSGKKLILQCSEKSQCAATRGTICAMHCEQHWNTWCNVVCQWCINGHSIYCNTISYTAIQKILLNALQCIVVWQCKQIWSHCNTLHYDLQCTQILQQCILVCH